MNFLFAFLQSFSETFQSNLNYAFTQNIGKALKFYNLGTDKNIRVLLCFQLPIRMKRSCKYIWYSSLNKAI